MKNQRAPTEGRTFRLAQYRSQRDRIKKHQGKDRVIRGTIPAGKPKPDGTQNDLGHDDRKREPRQVAQRSSAGVGRHRVVKTHGHRQKHHHDQEQQAAQVIPELTNADQETRRCRQEQGVTRQPERQGPGIRRRPVRAKRDPQPDEHQVGAQDVKRIARVQEPGEAPRRPRQEGASCLARSMILSRGRRLARIGGALLRITRSLQGAPPRPGKSVERWGRSHDVSRPGTGSRTIVLSHKKGHEKSAMPGLIINLYDNCRKR